MPWNKRTSRAVSKVLFPTSQMKREVENGVVIVDRFRREHIFSHLESTLNVRASRRRNEKKRREDHSKGTCNTRFYDSDLKGTPPNFSATSGKKETDTREGKKLCL